MTKIRRLEERRYFLRLLRGIIFSIYKENEKNDDHYERNKNKN